MLSPFGGEEETKAIPVEDSTLAEVMAVKLLYLESERQAALRSEHLAGRWAERKLKGFSEVKEVLEKMLQERYAPRTQTLTHKS